MKAIVTIQIHPTTGPSPTSPVEDTEIKLKCLLGLPELKGQAFNGEEVGLKGTL